MRNRGLKKLTAFDIFIFVFLSLYALIIFYPFYNAILTSLVSVGTYTRTPAMLIPPEIIFDNFQYLLSGPLIWSGYVSTLIIVASGTVYGMTISLMMAYAFSRQHFPGKKIIFKLMLFTLFFSGGLLPLYLLIRNLNLIDSRLAIILMFGMSPFFVIIMKTTFEQIPASIEEAAKIDGANDLTIFWSIMLPLQKPVIATFSLFTAVNYWNEWFWSMLIIQSREKMTLQLVLRLIINEAAADIETLSAMTAQAVFAQGVRMAAVVVTMLPIMLVYPFLQKYFVKGVMIGAIKM